MKMPREVAISSPRRSLEVVVETGKQCASVDSFRGEFKIYDLGAIHHECIPRKLPAGYTLCAP